jgi:hypothetical protein
MESLEVTWKRAMIVWWAFSWRTLLITPIGMIIGGVLGGIVSVLGTKMGLDQKILLAVITVISFPFGIAISVFILKLILKKRFSEFTICLVKN